MTELVSLLFAFMGSDEQLEAVLEQQSLGDIGAEVAASSSERVGTAAFLGFRVTPQYIHDLREREEETQVLITPQYWAQLNNINFSSNLLPLAFILLR